MGVAPSNFILVPGEASPEAILGLAPDLVLWVTDGGALKLKVNIPDLESLAFEVIDTLEETTDESG